MIRTDLISEKHSLGDLLEMILSKRGGGGSSSRKLEMVKRDGLADQWHLHLEI